MHTRQLITTRHRVMSNLSSVPRVGAWTLSALLALSAVAFSTPANAQLRAPVCISAPDARCGAQLRLGSSRLMPVAGGIVGAIEGTSSPDAPTPDTHTPPPAHEPPHSGGGGDDGGGHRRGGGSSSAIPVAIAGIAALALISTMLAEETAADIDEQAVTRQLLEHGPQLATSFNMSAFATRGLVKAGWPVVVEFEQDIVGPVDLRISAKGVSTYTWHLGAGRIGPRHAVILLPDEFGNALKPAVVAVSATEDDRAASTLRPFRVRQLGVGPRAVPRMVIGGANRPRNGARFALRRASRGLFMDRLLKVTSRKQTRAFDRFLFEPLNIHVDRNETTAYRFYSEADFDSIAVNFMKLEHGPDGLNHHLVNEHRIDEGVRKEHWVGRDELRYWDGRDRNRSISRGEHRIQVRAWDDDGDWTLAWSDALLTVTD